MILFLGILNLLLVLWQLITGMRWIKLSHKIHRKSGILLLVSTVAHAGLALTV
jgi:hypothetical protein